MHDMTEDDVVRYLLNEIRIDWKKNPSDLLSDEAIEERYQLELRDMLLGLGIEPNDTDFYIDQFFENYDDFETSAVLCHCCENPFNDCRTIVTKHRGQDYYVVCRNCHAEYSETAQGHHYSTPESAVAAWNKAMK
jgi:hypothetical protein